MFYRLKIINELFLNRHLAILLYMDERKKLGQRIRQSRLEAKLTQKELAALLWLKEDAVSSMERGKQDVSLGQLGILARVLRVDRSWLAFGEEQK